MLRVHGLRPVFKGSACVREQAKDGDRACEESKRTFRANMHVEALLSSIPIIHTVRQGRDLSNLVICVFVVLTYFLDLIFSFFLIVPS